MKTTEKIVAAALTVALGILLIGVQADMASVLMTVLGIFLVTLGVFDLCGKETLKAAIKIVCGVLSVLLGWLIVGVVLYVFAAVLVAVGIVCFYRQIKWETCERSTFFTVLAVLKPSLCVLVGLTLFFHENSWVFVLAGILTIAEGCVLLIDALKSR